MSTPHSKKSPRITPTRTVMGRVRLSYPRMLRLLVPLDFSGKSRQALRYALPIAHKFGARIILLHVLPTVRGEAARTAAQAAALQRLDKMAADLVPAALHHENLVLFGKPADQILAATTRQTVDLIVLTTKGEGGLKRRLLGGTAEQVMRLAPCPVLSVRRH